jgi:O-antigen ligase
MTWELFLRNPVLGVGFRAHEQVLNVGSSAHNGYLATLAEVGIVGFLAVAFLVVRGFRLLWVRSEDPEWMFGSSVLLGVAVAYLLLAVFERYLMNVGNPTSLLFLLCIMRPDFNKTFSAEEQTAQPVQEEEDTGEFVQGELRT